MMQEKIFSTKPTLKNKLYKEKRGHFPSWLHKAMPPIHREKIVAHSIKNHFLHTVCKEAKCPNQSECFSKKTAAFLLLGNICTRSCGFCEIMHSPHPPPPHKEEPQNIAATIQALQLTHAVLTMVTRDDLLDGGASHIASTIRSIRALNSPVTIEILASDFNGNHQSLHTLLAEEPEIFNHNIETVQRLSPIIRHKALYQRSLSILKQAKQSHKVTFVKSGIMLGFGEEPQEVLATLRHLAFAGVDIITIGQYLRPSRKKIAVKEFIHPSIFQAYKEHAYSLGVKYVYADPFVRSSYNAEKILHTLQQKNALSLHSPFT